MDGYSVTTLNATGYDAPVPNTHWTVGSDTLLIMLPGMGYSNQMPLMFYLHQLALARKWDVLQVDYDYRDIPRETSAEEWSARMYADTHPLIEAALARGEYHHIVLAGKSIGTNVMTTLLRRGFDKSTAHIWLTPLLRSKAVRQAVMSTPKSVAVFGDEDFAIAEVNLGAIFQAGVQLIILPGGDHGMITKNGVPESIAGLAQIVFELDTWLGQNVGTTGEKS